MADELNAAKVTEKTTRAATRTYEAPKIEELGTLEELTGSGAAGGKIETGKT